MPTKTGHDQRVWRTRQRKLKRIRKSSGKLAAQAYAARYGLTLKLE